MDEWDYPDEWDSAEAEMFYDLTDGIDAMLEDQTLQALFHDGLFADDYSPDEQQAIFETLVDYFYEEYDLEFNQEFDWEAFREWYG